MNNPTLMSIRAVYTQEKDGAQQPSERDQMLTMSLIHCGGDPYLVLSTDRWAVDAPDELDSLLTQFVQQTQVLFEQHPD